ncbi:hypothetical protein [Streptomyces specialis]|uniref:hypothetical protein n=1 Tax=Streptomyces specialis TaxID=498367 RepID=UPI0018FEF7A8|nr:hypothetical protein [Streptomyces specialis]
METLTLGQHSWDLCREHGVVFGRYLLDALGVPENGPAPEGTTDVPEPRTAGVVPTEGAQDEAAGESVEPSDTGTVEVAQATPEGGSRPGPVASVMVCGEVPGYSWEEPGKLCGTSAMKWSVGPMSPPC